MCLDLFRITLGRPNIENNLGNAFTTELAVILQSGKASGKRVAAHVDEQILFCSGQETNGFPNAVIGYTDGVDHHVGYFSRKFNKHQAR